MQRLISHQIYRINRLDALTQICDAESFAIFSIISTAFEATHESVVQTLNDMSVKLNDSMQSCKWRKMSDCPKLFKTILTEDGICFTFNSLNSQDIYTDEYVLGNVVLLFQSLHFEVE